ncbi:cupin domain-containing protein [Leifsonia bigeumensis]|uniref:Cupin domain-containing protein n=1 Tax=Leifsonella bigeumensis TaxID=433643 RepID=A0ABP7F9I7_9MICO
MSGPITDQEILVGTLPTTFRVLADHVGGAFSIVEQTVAPGVLVWPHVHTDHDQVAIVISGELGVRVGDREWTAGPGDIAVRPRHIPHTVWNAGSEPARFLEISAPGDFEEYFQRFSELDADDTAGRSGLQAAFGVSGVPHWVEELSTRYAVEL